MRASFLSRMKIWTRAVANIVMVAMVVTVAVQNHQLRKQLLVVTAEASTRMEVSTEVTATGPVTPVVAKTETGVTKTERLSVATIGLGGGYVSSFTKQLLASPQTFKKYRFEGDVTDMVAVTQWAEAQATNIAKRAGYIDWKFGGEVRVAVVDKLAPILAEDEEGNLFVHEFLKDEEGNFSSTPERIIGVSETESQSVFQAQMVGDGGDFVANASYCYFEVPI